MIDMFHKAETRALLSPSIVQFIILETPTLERHLIFGMFRGICCCLFILKGENEAIFVGSW
jgi:hypothetical protein